MSDLKRPEDICAEWTDDVRMNALFAPLRNRDLNPESWNAKILFWINLIEKWCTANSVAVLDTSEVKNIFIRNGKLPHCLPEVIHEAVARKNFHSPEAHLHTLGAPHRSWGSWALGLGTKAVRSIGEKVIGTSVSSFIVPAVVDKLEDTIYDELLKADRVMQSSRFKYIEDNQLESILNTIDHQMSRNFTLKVLLEKRRLIRVNLDKRTFFKIIEASEQANVDEVDSGLLHLKLNLDQIESEIPVIEKSIEEELSRAKKCLKEGSRTTAKTILRRKKRLETKLEKLLSQQLNLEKIYDEILNAQSNKSITQAYESGLAAMKIMIDPSMVEKADATMSELAEILETNQEFSDAIKIKDDDDLEDLESQLEDLLKDEEPADSIPADSPDKTKTDVDFSTALKNLEKLDMTELEPTIGNKKSKVAVQEASNM